MAINITLLLLLLSYSMVASQSFMYMLALKRLQLDVKRPRIYGNQEAAGYPYEKAFSPTLYMRRSFPI